jgi:hypothetical protein
MKISKCKIYLLLILFQSTSLFLTCNKITEPNAEIELILENGFYQKIAVAQNEIKYVVEFDYSVKGNECEIGGYSIQWDDNHGGQINWYITQKIFPGTKYSILDTMNLSHILTSDPIITMHGYIENKAETDSRLKDELKLKKK